MCSRQWELDRWNFYPHLLNAKKEINDYYRSQLQGVGDITFQQIDADVDCNMWLFTFRTDKQKEVLKVLNDNQMQSRPFWVPMNQLRMFKDDVFYNKDNQSDYIYQRCLSIPCSTNIKDEELAAVVEKIKSVY